jgi:hypothetical protein
MREKKRNTNRREKIEDMEGNTNERITVKDNE